MSRPKATPYNGRALLALAQELADVAGEIRELAATYDKESIDILVHVDNQASVDKGLRELRRLRRDVDGQLAEILDERNAAQKRKNRVVDASTATTHHAHKKRAMKT